MTPADFTNGFAVYAYAAAALLTYVLGKCGDDLSRENVMRQATTIRGYVNPMGIPGATINTSPDDYRVNRDFHLARFNGVSWEWFGDTLTD